MYIEKLINPVAPIFLRGNSADLSQSKNTFRDILKQALNNKSSSRPPKVELEGILIPCYEERLGRTYRFKLGTESSEYFLCFSDVLEKLARKAAWEEVEVKGYFNFDSRVVDVEKINLLDLGDAIDVPSVPREPSSDLDAYKRIIDMRGKLEPALDYMAS
jgi:hypothetical protein